MIVGLRGGLDVAPGLTRNLGDMGARLVHFQARLWIENRRSRRPDFSMNLHESENSLGTRNSTTRTTLVNSRESDAGEIAMSILLWGLVGLWLVLNGIIAFLLMRRKRSRIDDVQPLPFLVLSQKSGTPRLIG